MLAPLGALATLALALLAALPLDRELSYGFTRNTTATPASAPITPADGLPYTRRNIRFDSLGTSCDAWLYTPLTPPPPLPAAAAGGAAGAPFPVVIMAHGLGAQKELGLHRFADAFARSGLSVLVFDYRTFGGSDGEPRHWASPRRHLEDWREALRFVKSGALGPAYDTEKVALWGTSYAGGHVLVVASEQPPGSLAAVISMIPHLDGVEASKASVRRRGLAGSLRLLAAGLHDRLRAAAADVLHRTAATADDEPPPPPSLATTAAEAVPVAGLRRLVSEAGRRLRAALSPLAARLAEALGPRLLPAYVQVVGLESEMALMQLSKEQLRSYYSKHPAVYEGGWRPLVLARFTLETSSYSPINAVPRVTAPVLFVSALRDRLCPPELVRAAAALLPPPGSNASAHSESSSSGSSGSSGSTGDGGVGGGSGVELVELDCTHFDAYVGEHLAAATEAMVRFLRRHVLPPAAAALVPSAVGMEVEAQGSAPPAAEAEAAQAAGADANAGAASGSGAAAVDAAAAAAEAA